MEVTMQNNEVPMRPESGSMERVWWEFAFGDHTRDWASSKKSVIYRAEDNSLYSYDMKIARWIDDHTIEVLQGARQFSRTTMRHFDDATYWLTSRLKKFNVAVVPVEGVRVKAARQTEIGRSNTQVRDWWVYFEDEVPEGAKVFEKGQPVEVEAKHLTECILHAMAIRARGYHSYAHDHVVTFGSLHAVRGAITMGNLDLVRCKVYKRATPAMPWELKNREVKVLNLIGRQSWSWSYGQRIEPIILNSQGIQTADFSDAQRAVQQIVEILAVQHIPYEFDAGVEVDGQPAWEADHPIKGFLPMIRELWNKPSYEDEKFFDLNLVEDGHNWIDVASYGDYTGNLAIKAILRWMQENAEAQGWVEGEDYMFRAFSYHTESLWLRAFVKDTEASAWSDKLVTPIAKFWFKNFGPFMHDNEQRSQANSFDAFATFVYRQDFDYAGGQYFQMNKLPDFLKDTFNAVIQEEIESDLDNWVDWDFGLRWIIPGDRVERAQLYETMAKAMLTRVTLIDQGAHLHYDIDMIADALVAQVDKLDLEYLDPEDEKQKPLFDALVKRGVVAQQ